MEGVGFVEGAILRGYHGISAEDADVLSALTPASFVRTDGGHERGKEEDGYVCLEDGEVWPCSEVRKPAVFRLGPWTVYRHKFGDREQPYSVKRGNQYVYFAENLKDVVRCILRYRDV